MTEFDQKYDIVDEKTPPNVPLRGHYKRSFAYYTIRERLPVILTQVVDRLSQNKDDLVASIGDEQSRDDIKEAQGGIAKLKYEMQTDKPFISLDANEPDRTEWNEFLAAQQAAGRDSYFTATWLYTECYMYRRLKSIFEATATLGDFDYFAAQKRDGLVQHVATIAVVIRHLDEHISETAGGDANTNDDQLRAFFVKLLKLSLWGNRCDLSISLGRQIEETDGNDAFNNIAAFDQFMLVDRCAAIWDCLVAGGRRDDVVVDIVLDNSGYELFTDLVLVYFMLHHGLAGRVRFHAKAIPWFISDVTPADFEWTLRTLADSTNGGVAKFGQRLLDYQKEGRIEVRPVSYFWTGPWEFHRMAEVRPKLYADLGEAHLVIFKGDLNYRKLLGDFNWDFGTAFEEVLRGFRPTNVCSLRTIKADLVCELKDGISDELAKVDPMWMETGQYGVVHFAAKQ